MARRLVRLLVWVIDRHYFGPHKMSYFKTNLYTETVEGGFKLTQELVYHSDYLGRDVVVPIGFFTDFASVPWFFRWLVPVATGKNRKAAVVHDWLCNDAIQQIYRTNQAGADKVFREALNVCGVNPAGQWAMWTPVRAYQAIKGVFK